MADFLAGTDAPVDCSDDDRVAVAPPPSPPPAPPPARAGGGAGLSAAAVAALPPGFFIALEVCSVCQEVVDDDEKAALSFLACGHYGHEGCLAPWFASATKCPLCKALLPASPTGSALVYYTRTTARALRAATERGEKMPRGKRVDVVRRDEYAYVPTVSEFAGRATDVTCLAPRASGGGGGGDGCLVRSGYVGTIDADDFSIACDRCDRWFHGVCVLLPREEAAPSDTWTCPPCRGAGVRALRDAATPSS
jgi:hypothetical protein